LPICFPPLTEQRKIAKILATQDRVIELKKKLLEETKKRKKALLKMLMCPTEMKRLEAASPRGEAASCRFGDNNKLVFMGDIGFAYTGIIGKGKEDFGKGDAWYIPFLNVLKNTKIDLGNLVRVNVSKSEKQNVVQKGDLFFNISSETPDEVGLCAFLANKAERTYLNSFCLGFRLKPDAKIEPHYLAEWFNSCYGRRIMRSLAQGVTRYNLSREGLLSTPINLPPLSIQRYIAAILSAADREIGLLIQDLEQEKQKKKALMQLLLTGIVRVNEAAGSRFSMK
jgi:type I restriction enzyme S subunit